MILKASSSGRTLSVRDSDINQTGPRSAIYRQFALKYPQFLLDRGSTSFPMHTNENIMVAN